jgi:signal transduction histidine kinase
MPDGGEIGLVARLPGDGSRLYLFVSDTGVGIDPRRLERLFVPFQTTKKSGLGVGLPLVRRVMTRMGGDIEVESAPGRGTTVRLSWPVGPASSGAR